MASRLNPYLSFDGDAGDALAFYQHVFGGDLRVNRFGAFGTDDHGMADKVMHGQLETTSGFILMAADMPPGEERRPGNDLAVSLGGDDAEDLRGYWRALSAGGTVTVALERQPWGDEFGMCRDKFGTSWMVDIARTAPG
ncbi:VOC family protein [Arthrobacter castelli]|uniref:VOC family protein n=1 Tax=Arthrobacter castelli TaxID=271431 RepID=UPI0003FA007C|nr:VOC family protein [Arthrobacter castelli]